MGRQLNTFDLSFMALACMEAGYAAERGERPFGCVIVDPAGEVIGTGGGSESAVDPTRHSEMEAIRMACGYRNGYLNGCTIYSTHEPCLMCTGAILHAKISEVVYGTCREDLPTLFRPYSLQAERRWSETTHPPLVTSGCLHHRCISLFDREVLERKHGVLPRGVSG